MSQIHIFRLPEGVATILSCRRGHVTEYQSFIGSGTFFRDSPTISEQDSILFDIS